MDDILMHVLLSSWGTAQQPLVKVWVRQETLQSYHSRSTVELKTKPIKTKPKKTPNQNPLPSLWGFYIVFFLATITSHASYANKKSLKGSGGQNSLSIFIYFKRLQFFSGLMNTHSAFHVSWATAITCYKQKSSYKTYKKPHAIHFVGITCKAS